MSFSVLSFLPSSCQPSNATLGCQPTLVSQLGCCTCPNQRISRRRVLAAMRVLSLATSRAVTTIPRARGRGTLRGALPPNAVRSAAVVSPSDGWDTHGGGKAGHSARNAHASATFSIRACAELSVPGAATELSLDLARRASERVTSRSAPCTPGGRYTTASGCAARTAISPATLEREYAENGA